jgi:hypothetical protein
LMATIRGARAGLEVRAEQGRALVAVRSGPGLVAGPRLVAARLREAVRAPGAVQAAEAGRDPRVVRDRPGLIDRLQRVARRHRDLLRQPRSQVHRAKLRRHPRW